MFPIIHRRLIGSQVVSYLLLFMGLRHGVPIILFVLGGTLLDHHVTALHVYLDQSISLIETISPGSFQFPIRITENASDTSN